MDQSGKTRTRHGPERRLQGRRFSRRGPLCRYHRRADERSSFEDARCRRHRQSREEPSRQDRSSGHGRCIDAPILFKGQTLIAYFDDPIAAPKVAVRFRQEERQAGHSRRRDGQDRAQRRRREGARHAAVARRAARQAGWHDRTPATRIAQLVNAPAASVARVIRRLCPEGRGGVRPFLAIINTVRTFKELKNG